MNAGICVCGHLHDHPLRADDYDEWRLFCQQRRDDERARHPIKVPANRLPSDFGFMIAHPVATVALTKLEDYRVHHDPPGISGDLVEGRICYDAFVLDNKKAAIYYQGGACLSGQVSQGTAPYCHLLGFRGAG